MIVLLMLSVAILVAGVFFTFRIVQNLDIPTGNQRIPNTLAIPLLGMFLGAFGILLTIYLLVK